MNTNGKLASHVQSVALGLNPPIEIWKFIVLGDLAHFQLSCGSRLRTRPSNFMSRSGNLGSRLTVSTVETKDTFGTAKLGKILFF